MVTRMVTTKDRALEMLKELERLPWHRDIVKSLLGWAEKKEFTSKQLSLISSLYIDNCVISDGDIQEQIECRKLCFRLLKTKLGRLDGFVSSVTSNTNKRRFSQAQMRAVRKVAKTKALATTPELNETNFDGWFELANLDKPVETT